jgi:hypothetical protein
MKKITILLLTSLIFPTLVFWGQETKLNQEEVNKEKLTFTNTLDSLFLEN